MSPKGTNGLCTEAIKVSSETNPIVYTIVASSPTNQLRRMAAHVIASNVLIDPRFIVSKVLILSLQTAVLKDTRIIKLMGK